MLTFAVCTLYKQKQDTMNRILHTVIIGSGPAGLEAAARIARKGFEVLVLEKEPQTGGKLSQWDRLFPDFQKAEEIKNALLQRIPEKGIEIRTSAEVTGISPEGKDWKVTLADGESYTAHSLLFATGFDPFDATRKEEYGYKIYPNVITSVELESMIGKGEIRTADGRIPQTIAYIQCVGSRDEKVGNHYCSVNCCICAVKQTMEVHELLPDVKQFCFYMDLRMTGQHYEERYRESQEKHHVNFIRGRVSETAPTREGRLLVKAEDTLLSRPIKLETDLLVLMVGMEASASTRRFSKELQMSDAYGFFESENHETDDNKCRHKGIFVAGSCKRPMPIPQTLKDADAAALEIMDYLDAAE